MTDLPDAERRLIAALERIDHSVERAARRLTALVSQPAAEPAQPSAAEHRWPAAEAADISPDVAALHDRQGATLEAMRVRLAEAHERLAETGNEAARLAAANESLARANRALIDAAETGGVDADGIQAALQAEIESLHAARAAEVAQMSEILDALDRMLGVTTTPRSHSTGGRALPARRGRAAKADPAPRAGDAAGSESVLRELTVVPDHDTLIDASDLPADPDPADIRAAAQPDDQGDDR